MFTTGEDSLPEAEIMKSIFDKEKGGGLLLDSKADDKNSCCIFAAVLPDYERACLHK